MWCAYRSVWITIWMYNCVRWVCKGFASDRSPCCGLQVRSCSPPCALGKLHQSDPPPQSSWWILRTTDSHVASIVEGPGIRPGFVGPVQESANPACLSSQAPSLQYRTSAGSPANQSPTSPVSNQGFSPGSSPQVRAPPLALCHLPSPMCQVLSCAVTRFMPSAQGCAPTR